MLLGVGRVNESSCCARQSAVTVPCTCTDNACWRGQSSLATIVLTFESLFPANTVDTTVATTCVSSEWMFAWGLAWAPACKEVAACMPRVAVLACLPGYAFPPFAPSCFSWCCCCSCTHILAGCRLTFAAALPLFALHTYYVLPTTASTLLVLLLVLY